MASRPPRHLTIGPRASGWRGFLVAALLTCFLLPATSTQAALEAENGASFLARDTASRSAYVAGLADQLLQLHNAGLVRGFHWYVRCLQRPDAPALAEALSRYIAAEPARSREPAARNFIWAAVEVCPYP